MFKNLKKVLFSCGLVIALAMGLAGCSSALKTSAITLGPSKVSVEEGQSVSLVVVFSDLETVHSSVDVYTEANEEPVVSKASISDNTLTISSSVLPTGTSKVYVKEGDLKSNSITVSVSALKKEEPKNPELKIISAPSYNKFYASSGTSYYTVNVELNNVDSYSYDDSPVVNFYVDDKFYTNISLDSKSYTTLSLNSYSLGVHKLYAELPELNLVSNTIEFEIINEETAAATVITSLKEINTKIISINYLNNGSRYYQIWRNTENDLETANFLDYRTYSYSLFDYEYLSSLSEGTYYYWVVSSNTSSSDKSEGVASKPVVHEYTKYPAVAPSWVKVTPARTSSGNRYRYTVTWEDCGAPNYAVYYSTDPEATSGTCINYGNYSALGFTTFPLTSSGTYYFWVKPYSSNRSEDNPISKKVSCNVNYVKPDYVPTGVTITESSSYKNTVYITWSSDDYYYHGGYYSDSNDVTTARKINYTTSSSIYVKLPATGTYYFWVRCADSSSNEECAGDFMEIPVSYELTSSNSSLLTPTNFTVDPDYSTYSIELSCDTVSGTSYYVWYYGTSDNILDARRLTYKSSNILTYSKSNFEKNQTYYFWVCASSYSDPSSYSSNSSLFSESVSCIPNP